MVMEPERPIEKLLRACARKRRDEAGTAFELHPVNRRLLQGEVARQFKAGERKTRSFLQLLPIPWARVAWGAAVVAVLGVAAWVLVPGLGRQKPEFGSELRLARNLDMPSPPGPASRPTPPAARPGVATEANKEQPLVAFDASAEQARRDQGARKLEIETVLADKDRSLSLTPTTAGVPVAADALAETSPSNAKAPSAERQLAGTAISRQSAPSTHYRFPAGAAAPTVPPPAAAPAGMESGNLPLNEPAASGDLSKQLNRADTALAYQSAKAQVSTGQFADARVTNSFGLAAASEALAANQIVQRFTQAQPAAQNRFYGGNLPSRPVLVSFQLEQSGQTVRVIDGDGSIYTGTVQPLGLGSLQRERAGGSRAENDVKLKLGPPVTDAVGQITITNYFSFKVAGTNRSLRQNVIFTGSLLPRTNGPALPSGGVINGVGGQMPSVTGALLPNTHITGQLKIGNRQQIEINAVPAN
jgi:hypothetical protein